MLRYLTTVVTEHEFKQQSNDPHLTAGSYNCYNVSQCDNILLLCFYLKTSDYNCTGTMFFKQVECRKSLFLMEFCNYTDYDKISTRQKNRLFLNL